MSKAEDTYNTPQNKKAGDATYFLYIYIYIYKLCFFFFFGVLKLECHGILSILLVGLRQRRIVGATDHFLITKHFIIFIYFNLKIT